VSCTPGDITIGEGENPSSATVWRPTATRRCARSWVASARLRNGMRTPFSGSDHATLALFRGHSLKMRDGLLHLGAVAMGTLHLVGIVLLETQMHFERLVTGLTIIIIGWHTLSFTCENVFHGHTLPEVLCKDSARHCKTLRPLPTGRLAGYPCGTSCRIFGQAVVTGCTLCDLAPSGLHVGLLSGMAHLLLPSRVIRNIRTGTAIPHRMGLRSAAA
jgi:hypothetical protein